MLVKPGFCLSSNAHEVLLGMCLAFGIEVGPLVRVIVESVLDAAADDGDLQRELVEAVHQLVLDGRVPGCWLQEDDGEDEPPDPETDAWARAGAKRCARRWG